VIVDKDYCGFDTPVKPSYTGMSKTAKEELKEKTNSAVKNGAAPSHC
jgi:hypothetical protein